MTRTSIGARASRSSRVMAALRASPGPAPVERRQAAARDADAEPDGQQRQRHQHQPFASRQVGAVLPLAAGRSPKSPLHQAQQVGGGKHQAGERQQRPERVGAEGAEQHQDLADEVGQSGQAEGSQRRRAGRRPTGWACSSPQPAELGQIAGAGATGGSWRPGRTGAPVVMPWVIISRMLPCQAVSVPGGQTEDHQAEMGDRRVGQQAFDVVLPVGAPGGVEEPDQGQRRQQRQSALGGSWGRAGRRSGSCP